VGVLLVCHRGSLVVGGFHAMDYRQRLGGTDWGRIWSRCRQKLERIASSQLGRIVPEAIQLDEIRDTGLGVLGMCACDFWVSRFGWLPIPPVRNNDMLCRVSAKICKGGKVYRAYYTLRSDSSSRFLGFALGHVLLPQIQLSISADRLPARDVRPAGGVGLRDVHAKHEADLGNLVALS
jgi:hypothetical protein